MNSEHLIKDGDFPSTFTSLSLRLHRPIKLTVCEDTNLGEKLYTAKLSPHPQVRDALGFIN